MTEGKIKLFIDDLKQLIEKHEIDIISYSERDSDEFFGKILIHANLNTTTDLVILDSNIKHFD